MWYDKGIMLKVTRIVSNSAKALLELAKMAEQLPDQPGEPKDISGNHLVSQNFGTQSQ